MIVSKRHLGFDLLDERRRQFREDGMDASFALCLRAAYANDVAIDDPHIGIDGKLFLAHFHAGRKRQWAAFQVH